MSEQFHGTTIICTRRGDKVAMAGDGQVTFGNTVLKENSRKVRALAEGKVLTGFAGATADAFTLLDVMRCVEEPLALNICLTHENDCGRSVFCPVHGMWAEVKETMEEVFSRKSVAQVVREMQSKQLTQLEV